MTKPKSAFADVKLALAMFEHLKVAGRGKRNAIKRDELARLFCRGNVRKYRACREYLQESGYPIGYGNDGVYFACDAQELREAAAQCESRAMKELRQKSQLLKQAEELERGLQGRVQQKLFA